MINVSSSGSKWWSSHSAPGPPKITRALWVSGFFSQTSSIRQRSIVVAAIWVPWSSLSHAWALPDPRSPCGNRSRVSLIQNTWSWMGMRGLRQGKTPSWWEKIEMDIMRPINYVNQTSLKSKNVENLSNMFNMVNFNSHMPGCVVINIYFG